MAVVSHPSYSPDLFLCDPCFPKHEITAMRMFLGCLCEVVFVTLLCILFCIHVRCSMKFCDFCT